MIKPDDVIWFVVDHPAEDCLVLMRRTVKRVSGDKVVSVGPEGSTWTHPASLGIHVLPELAIDAYVEKCLSDIASAEADIKQLRKSIERANELRGR